MTCVRRAWLTLDGNSIELHNERAGYFVTSLDLGSPEVREVTNARPDQHGIDDRTRLWGGRAVSADISAISDAGAVIDAVAASFAPYMVPTARPVLHYILDRPGAPERTLIVRAAAYAFAVDQTHQRDIQLQWIAADPIAYDPEVQQARALAGSGGGAAAGRTYDLAFSRTYPGGGGSPSTGILHGDGDVAIQPLLRIYGPITGPMVAFVTPAPQTFRVAFLSSFTVGAGAWVEVDTKARTAYYNGDRTQNMLARIDWTATTWPVLPARVDNRMSLTGGNTNQVTQAVATWQDGFLS